jgi:hypothetical protein
MEKMQTSPREEIGTIDLQPTPRVLRMLGNISFENWQCFAELIDNSIDAMCSSDIGTSISIDTPTKREFESNPDASITCWDDGPGMTAKQLQDSMKAGYSSNDPLSYLGLFGMGFNIASARLGNTTQVITSREGDEYWISVIIDLKKMEKERSYIRPLYKIKKEKSEHHGTIVIISDLLDRARTIRHQNSIKKKLSRIYSPIIKKGKVKIFFNDEELFSFGHCIWGPQRYVKRKNPNETIPAYMEIDQIIGKEYYCENCWEWIPDAPVQEGVNSIICPKCNESSGVSVRERKLTGWVGVQRYYDPEHYGFDLIRNGRVIEELDKSLFYWMDPETGDLEKEYVLDSPIGGRIIGELNIDFVPLTYMKDHFERADRTWGEMEKVVRGIGPLRPEKADERGFPRNDSYLGRIYRGYKKANKVGYDDLLPGKLKPDGSWGFDNRTPKLWAEHFYAGEPDYKDDLKWWELIEQTEKMKRGSSETSLPTPPQKAQTVSSVITNGTGTQIDQQVCEPQAPYPASSEIPSGLDVIHEKDAALSQEYMIDQIGENKINVIVNKLSSGDLGGLPLKIRILSKDNFEAIYDPKHPFFNEFSQEPLDLLLLELAQKFSQRKDDVKEWPPSRIYCLLKEKYSQDKLLSPKALADKSNDMLNSIKKHIVDLKITVNPDSISKNVIDEVRRKVLSKLRGGDPEVNEILKTTAYLAYAPDEELVYCFLNNPALFLDNHFWNIPFTALGTQELREEVKNMISGYMNDIIWLKKEAAEYNSGPISTEARYRLQRASISMKLLESYCE